MKLGGRFGGFCDVRSTALRVEIAGSRTKYSGCREPGLIIACRLYGEDLEYVHDPVAHRVAGQVSDRVQAELPHQVRAMRLRSLDT